MPRISFFICCGFCLISTACLNAQHLRGKPTLQQIVGYQLKQVQDWQTEQLPANVVISPFKKPVQKSKANDIPDEMLFLPVVVNPVHQPIAVLETPVNEVSPIHLTYNLSYTYWLKQSPWHIIRKKMGN